MLSSGSTVFLPQPAILLLVRTPLSDSRSSAVTETYTANLYRHSKGEKRPAHVQKNFVCARNVSCIVCQFVHIFSSQTAGWKGRFQTDEEGGDPHGKQPGDKECALSATVTE